MKTNTIHQRLEIFLTHADNKETTDSFFKTSQKDLIKAIKGDEEGWVKYIKPLSAKDRAELESTVYEGTEENTDQPNLAKEDDMVTAIDKYNAALEVFSVLCTKQLHELYTTLKSYEEDKRDTYLNHLPPGVLCNLVKHLFKEYDLVEGDSPITDGKEAKGTRTFCEDDGELEIEETRENEVNDDDGLAKVRSEDDGVENGRAGKWRGILNKNYGRNRN
jgi:hypothetical protein